MGPGVRRDDLEVVGVTTPKRKVPPFGGTFLLSLNSGPN
jgi:hypothetical protein